MKHKLSPEERERAARKPMPRTFRAWMSELMGVADFARQKPRLKDANGLEWFRSMATYNRARVIVLGENPPGNFPPRAASVIVDWLLGEID